MTAMPAFAAVTVSVTAIAGVAADGIMTVQSRTVCHFPAQTREKVSGLPVGKSNDTMTRNDDPVTASLRVTVTSDLADPA